MSISVNIAGSFSQFFVLAIFFCLIGKIPHINVVGRGSANLDGAVFAKDIQGLFEVLWIYIGRSLDGSDGSVFKINDSAGLYRVCTGS